MAKPKLTPWFPEDVKPKRKGVYQAQFGHDDEGPPEFHYWDGNRWWYGTNTADGTAREYEKASPRESEPIPKPWRGLASDPRAAK